jgi:hypothetical protein
MRTHTHPQYTSEMHPHTHPRYEQDAYSYASMIYTSEMRTYANIYLNENSSTIDEGEGRKPVVFHESSPNFPAGKRIA